MMRRWANSMWFMKLAAVMVMVIAAGWIVAGITHAIAEPAAKKQTAPGQVKKQRPPPPATPEVIEPAQASPAANPAAIEPSPPVRENERLEADVSARSIAVTANFKGSEVVVFGTVANSRQPSPESGYYDVIVAVEGASLPAVVRRKSHVAGLWVNTAAARFDRSPSYYAVASTRPLDEIAEADVLAKYGIGIENVPLTVSPKTVNTTTASELRDFEAALGRLKIKQGLYSNADQGVVFSGSSLFRSTLALPANVPVGPLVARIYLFREGVLLNRFTTRVALERTGIERLIHDAAHNSSWLYGIVTVGVAVLCGLIASVVLG